MLCIDSRLTDNISAMCRYQQKVKRNCLYVLHSKQTNDSQRIMLIKVLYIQKKK